MIDFKELAHMIVGAGKFEIFRAGCHVGDKWKDWCCILSSKAVWGQNPSFLREPRCFILRPSVIWMSSTDTTKANLFYSK